MMTRFLVSLCVLALVPLAASAQSPGERRAGERIGQLKKVRMIEALDLSEEQSIRFFARLNEHEKTKQALEEKKGDVLDKLERLIRNDADGEEYAGLFPSIADLDSQMRREDTRFFESLSDLLSESQRAKFLLFGRQFHRELRDALQYMQRRRQGS